MHIIKTGRTFRIWSAVALVVSGCTVLEAQEGPRPAFSVGGGFTQSIGGAGRRLDTGWNAMGGAGVTFNKYFGTMVDVGYNRFGINQATLRNVGFPDGTVGVFSATLDPVIHVNATSHADFYIIGGAGLYRTTREFTQPSSATIVGLDPFFGFYTLRVPTTQVLSSYSVNKPGFNAGAGFAFGTKWHGKIFAEARYNRILIGNDRYMDFIPVTFGFRW